MIARNAWAVYSKTAAVCIAVCLANKAVEYQLQPRIHDRAIRWAITFSIVQAMAILFLSLSLLAVRAYRGIRKSAYDQIRPAIRDRVLGLAFEGESWSTGIPSHGSARHVVDESIADALASLKASGKDRIARFALEQGFAAQWVKAFYSRAKGERRRAISLLGLISAIAGDTILPLAVDDKHPAVRAEAYRALLRLGDPSAIDRVFRSVLREPLLMRALLADDLKRHASFLLKDTIPSLLENRTSLETARCLEILIAWGLAIPSFELKPWLSEPLSAHIGSLFLTLLPYIPTDHSIDDYLISALKSSHLELQCAAAEVSGRLKVERLIPALSVGLNQNKRLALASANAIAQMGEPGERWLERIVIGPDRVAAAVAMDALEHVTVGALL